jgi:membrane-bound serine protease (ClpP class)
VALGVAGATVLIAGALLLVAGLGGGVLLELSIVVVLTAIACAWMVAAIRTAARSRGTRIHAGSEALFGRVGVVRRWSESAGQVFVDGALWRARQNSLQSDEESFQEGEPIVVEGVSGLTLSVRRAEDWELTG